jgi:hypothetical protein
VRAGWVVAGVQRRASDAPYQSRLGPENEGTRPLNFPDWLRAGAVVLPLAAAVEELATSADMPRARSVRRPHRVGCFGAWTRGRSAVVKAVLTRTAWRGLRLPRGDASREQRAPIHHGVAR